MTARRWCWLLVLLLVCACGDNDEEDIYLEEDEVNEGGGGGSGLGGNCEYVSGSRSNKLSLTKLEGPIGDVEADAQFVAKGRYTLVDPEQGYFVATICGTVCMRQVSTPPVQAGSGTYSIEFEVVTVLDEEKADHCIVISMVDTEGEAVLNCTFHP